MKNTDSTTNIEKLATVQNGWLFLFIHLILWFAIPALFIFSFIPSSQQSVPPNFWMIGAAVFLIVFNTIMSGGFFTLQPNEARVLVLFGNYIGTVRKSGFHWGNPFYSNGPALPTGEKVASNEQAANVVTKTKHTRNKISLRARNLNGDKVKVNDNTGNPIEIAAVVVWKVKDTAQAMFDVDDYKQYVKIQYESAIRQLASAYAYDNAENDGPTLRGSIDEVSTKLQVELEERLKKAGVEIEEARITHLAYAPEIAQLMLRRQQAEAIIAARQKIVHGAVGMVELALKDMSQKQILDLDDDKKASMVSNLMVVLCGESEVHPVVNTGTLYQ